MKTILYKQNQLQEITNLLLDGRIIALPTDTVYGLAIDSKNAIAYSKLKKIKERDETKQFLFVVADFESLQSIAILDNEVIPLIKKLSSYQITFILKKKIDYVINSKCNYTNIAVRIVNNQFLFDLMKHSQTILMLPSANPKDLPPALNHIEALKYFDEKIEAVVEGDCYNNRVSTIIDLTNNMKILREGSISKEEIIKIWKN